MWAQRSPVRGTHEPGGVWGRGRVTASVRGRRGSRRGTICGDVAPYHLQPPAHTEKRAAGWPSAIGALPGGGLSDVFVRETGRPSRGGGGRKRGSGNSHRHIPSSARRADLRRAWLFAHARSIGEQSSPGALVAWVQSMDSPPAPGQSARPQRQGARAAVAAVASMLTGRDTFAFEEPQEIQRPKSQPATGAGRYECKTCGQRFESAQQLGGHQNLHRNGQGGRNGQGQRSAEVRKKPSGSIPRTNIVRRGRAYSANST